MEILNIRNMSKSTNLLSNYGFEFFESWEFNPEDDIKFKFDLSEVEKNSIFLYAFVIEEKVMYIGKSDRIVKARMNYWANRKRTVQQKTKSRNEFNIAVEGGKEVQIWLCFPEFNVPKERNWVGDGLSLIQVDCIDDSIKKRYK